MTETHLKLYPPPPGAEDDTRSPRAAASTGFAVAAVLTGAFLGAVSLLIDWFVGKLLG